MCAPIVPSVLRTWVAHRRYARVPHMSQSAFRASTGSPIMGNTVGQWGHCSCASMPNVYLMAYSSSVVFNVPLHSHYTINQQYVNRFCEKLVILLGRQRSTKHVGRVHPTHTHARVRRLTSRSLFQKCAILQGTPLSLVLSSLRCYKLVEVNWYA